MGKIRVGIPRAVQFYQHYPLWRTFFEELGAETVVSPPTNRETVTAGSMLVADVTCLPVKVYAGHVCWLRDHGEVDFVFAPAIWDLERGAFHCTKLKALPDVIQATVPECPPLLVADVDPYHRGLKTDEAFMRVGRELTKGASKLRGAWKRAREVDDRFREMIVREQLTYPEAVARLYGREWLTSERLPNTDSRLVVGLLGHSYCLYDDYINHDLIRHLSALGVRVLTSEMVPPEAAQRGIERTTRQVRWFYDAAMSGAAGYFLYETQAAGVIAVLAFGCGTDSIMIETINRRARAMQRPCMNLVLDEHGSATGMLTRLEAFVDMLSRRGTSVAGTYSQVEAPPDGARATHGWKRTNHCVRGRPDGRADLRPDRLADASVKTVLGVPSMGTVALAVKSMFEGLGVQVEMGPPPSKRTWDLGAKSAPEFMCTPYKQLLGNMIEMLEAGANTLVYIDAVDACRTSSYHQLMEDALHDLGYKFRFIIWSDILEGGIFGMPRFLRRFAPGVSQRTILREIALTLSKIRAYDDVERRVQYTRPREAAAGEVDKAWAAAITRLDEARDAASLKRAKADVIQKIERIRCDPSRRPLRIGLTGEMFASLDPFYNQDLERQLGRLGAEVHRTLMVSNWMRAEMVLAALGLPYYRDLQRATRRYMRTNVVGPTLGDTVLCAEQGFDGMVEVLPFTCMPHITALNILPRVIQDYDIPVLTFIFDEQSASAGMQARLEAFVDLLQRRRSLREARKSPAPAATAVSQARLDQVACAACPASEKCPQGTPVAHSVSCPLNAEAARDRMQP